MLPSLHAIAILGTVIIPLIAIACNPGWSPSRFRQALPFVLAPTATGVLCLHLLNVTGVPIVEWALPVVATMATGVLVKSQRAFRLLAFWLMVGAIGLCVNSLALRVHGYTSDPEMTARMYDAEDHARTANLGHELLIKFSPDRVFPESPLREILPEDKHCERDQKGFRRLWHTWFTGLWEITSTPGEVWYPGGAVGSAAVNLKWKRKG